MAATKFLELASTFLGAGGELISIDRSVAGAWIEETARALEDVAHGAGHSVRDYACTLLAAIVGEASAAFVQIGDGAIVVSEGVDDGWSWVFWPQHGEFANTTNFIVSANAADVMDFASTRRRIEEVAVFSDGIENLVLHHSSKSVHAAFFDAMFPPVRRAAGGLDEKLSVALEKYLSSPIVCERTDDDKTLVLASRRAGPP